MAPALAAGPSKGDPLLVTAVYNAYDLSRVDVKLVDVASGAIVNHLDKQKPGHLAATGGLIFLAPTGRNALSIGVLNPATGTVTNIPAGTPENGGPTPRSAYVFGQVPATGGYKVLRIDTTGGHAQRPSQSCEILSLGGRWRSAPSPPVLVNTMVRRHRAVTQQGFAHFLTTAPLTAGDGGDFDGIASFDLAKEEWRPSLLQGPLPSTSRNCCRSSLSLVELNGHLVFVYHDYRSCCIDMWVLTDLEKGTWLGIESLHLSSILHGWEDPKKKKDQPAPLIPTTCRRQEIFAQPLMVLGDGRIAFWVGVPYGAVKVYDPKTGKCEEVVYMGKSCSMVGLYKSQLDRVGVVSGSLRR
jgi:F-box interacting protein